MTTGDGSGTIGQGRDRPPRPLEAAERARAEERAQHVIVLMLENRSFDHLFGLLDHPRRAEHPEDFVTVGQHPNPYEPPTDRPRTEADPNPPPSPVAVSADGDPHLTHDPPHGHRSAMRQLARRDDGFAMDGFVAAYADKIGGREEVTTPRWLPLGALLVLLIAPLLAAAVYAVARLGIDGGWLRSWGFVAFVPVPLVLAGVGLRLYWAPGLDRRTVTWVLGLVGVVFAFSMRGVDFVWGRPTTLGSWWFAVALVLVGVLFLARDRLAKARQVPPWYEQQAAARIMACMPEGHVPVLAHLAEEYALCTRWHSSVPGATWPNRNFAHAATSDESVDIELGYYEDDTVFDLLPEPDPGGHGERDGPEPWRIYHQGMAQVMAFPRLWKGERGRRWHPVADLLEDIAADGLPRYAFVEPAHDGPTSNSQHPGNNEDPWSEDFARGEGLVAALYDALVAQPEVFAKTVLVVTYDEHGGFFDHVPPPDAVRPDAKGRADRLMRRLTSWFLDHGAADFDFSHLGPRVPAVVVSPWIARHHLDRTPYEHSSIVSTVRRRFAPLADPLTERDATAHDLLHLVVDLDEPRAVPRLAAAAWDGRVVADSLTTADEPDDPPRGLAGLQVGTDSEVDAQLGQLGRLVRRDLFKGTRRRDRPPPERPTGTAFTELTILDRAEEARHAPG